MDWTAVRQFYVETRSLKAAAEKFGVPLGSVKARAHREKWSAGMQPNGEAGMQTPSQMHTGTHTGAPSGMQNEGPMHTSVHTEFANSTPLHTGMHTGMHTGDRQPCIPADINALLRLDAARFYHGRLGWAVHALCPPDRGEESERGKKPIAKGWRDHVAAEVTPDYLPRATRSSAWPCASSPRRSNSSPSTPWNP